jgi:DNA-binding PadR family transcriptional regulator
MVLTEKSAGYIREMLGSMSRMGYVKSFRIEVSYKVRSENMYFITPKGLEMLESHKNVFIDYPKMPARGSTVVVVKDFFHRFNTTSVNIAIYLHLLAHNVPIRLLASYFDKLGSAKKKTLTARTTIPLDGLGYYIPDSVIMTDHCLYLIEMYCDKNSDRIMNQLGTHAKAIALGTPGKTFGIAANPLVLCVFEHESIKEAVMKRLKTNENFDSMSKLFFFASLADVKTDCANAWHTINNEFLKM